MATKKTANKKRTSKKVASKTTSDKKTSKNKSVSKSNDVNDPEATPDEPPRLIEISAVFRAIIKGYQEDGGEDDKTAAKRIIKDYLSQALSGISGSSEYNIVVLFDSSTMVKRDADSIYNAVTSFSNNKPILLVLYSNGGEIGSAYLIGQLCREHSNGKFVISVPRQAKSAATLLCCAADEIHMGSLSELGPIDPQINGLPALGLKNSIQHIANLVKETPESAEMFARYLNYSVRPIDLGYYERVAESAMQYAERLLSFNESKLPKEANAIAHDLVYAYKDHGFVLDKNESNNIFGDKLIQIDTMEYEIGNKIYSTLSNIKIFYKYFGYDFYLVGCIDSDPIIIKRSPPK